MIVKNQIGRDLRNAAGSGESPFASLYKGNFSVSKKILKASTTSDIIALKDVKYRLEGGIFYVQATQIFHENLSRFATYYETYWRCRNIYIIGERQLELLENPPEIKEVIIKRWWRNNLKFKAYEHPEEASYWFKLKEERPFEAALSNFKFREDGNAWPSES
jgi:hypothetical protein